MARFSFGGGDYSGLFADLYRQQENLTKQVGADTKAQQAADDQDAYDQWRNGLISDEEWLAYIARRRDETASEPKEHEKWVKLERQYTRSIADNRAQADYEAGRISAAQYIAYQKDVLPELDAGSEAYRERAQIVQQLEDAQAQRDVTTRAQEVLDGISLGRNTSKDLLQVYQDGLGHIRSGSDFYKQVQSEIVKVQSEIRDDSARATLEKIQYDFGANKITGKEAGRRIRLLAERIYSGNAAKYYQILQSAQSFEKYPGLYGAGTGGGRGPSDAVRAHIATLRANIDRVKDITAQYIAAGGKGVGVDPMTNDPVDFQDTEFIRGMHRLTLGRYDQLKAVYVADHDATKARDVDSAKMKFIVGEIQPANTVVREEQAQHLLSAANARIVAAAEETDPRAALNAATQAASDIETWVARASQTLTPDLEGPGRPGIPGRLGPLVPSGKSRSPQSLPTPDLFNDLGAYAKALRALAQPGLTEAQVQDLIVGLDLGTQRPGLPRSLVGPGLDKVVSAGRMAAGLENGTMTYVIVTDPKRPDRTVIGVADYLQVSEPYLGPDGTMLYRAAPQVNLPGKFAPVGIAINGKTTVVQAEVLPAKSPYQAWYSKKDDKKKGLQAGAIIPDAVIRTLVSQNLWDGLIARKEIVKGDAMDWYKVVIPERIDNGKKYAAETFLTDKRLGTWTQGSPINGTVMMSDREDGTISVDDVGAPTIIWAKRGSADQLPYPMQGDVDIRKGMNELVRRGVLPTEGLGIVDGDGNVVPAPKGSFDNAYWDPAYDIPKKTLDDVDTHFWDVAARKRRRDAQLLQDRHRDRRELVPLRSPAADGVEALATQFGITTRLGRSSNAPGLPSVRQQPSYAPLPRRGGLAAPRIVAPLPILPSTPPITAPTPLPILNPDRLKDDAFIPAPLSLTKPAFKPSPRTSLTPL